MKLKDALTEKEVFKYLTKKYNTPNSAARLLSEKCSELEDSLDYVADYHGQYEDYDGDGYYRIESVKEGIAAFMIALRVATEQLGIEMDSINSEIRKYINQICDTIEKLYKITLPPSKEKPGMYEYYSLGGKVLVTNPHVYMTAGSSDKVRALLLYSDRYEIEEVND